MLKKRSATCAAAALNPTPDNTNRPGHKKQGRLRGALGKLAEWTGLEPATLGVTGRYSNRLNYHSTALVGAEGFEPPTLAL